MVEDVGQGPSEISVQILREIEEASQSLQRRNDELNASFESFKGAELDALDEETKDEIKSDFSKVGQEFRRISFRLDNRRTEISQEGAHSRGAAASIIPPLDLDDDQAKGSFFERQVRRVLPGKSDFKVASRRTIKALFLTYFVLVALNYVLMLLANTHPAFRALSEGASYVARLTGTFPVACTASINAKTSGKPNPASNSESDWTRDGTPLFVQLVHLNVYWPGGEFTELDTPCAWLVEPSEVARQSWLPVPIVSTALSHAVAWISPDVGTFQKVTLFVFLLSGSVWLGRIQDDDKEAKEFFDPELGQPSDESGAPVPVISIGNGYFLYPLRNLALLKSEKSVLSVAQQREMIEQELFGAAGGNRKPLPGPPPIKDAYEEFVLALAKTARDRSRRAEHRHKLLTAGLNSAAAIAAKGRDASLKSELSNRLEREEERLEAAASQRFTLVEYSVWLIPTIGFLGTIFGIGGSLLEARGVFTSSSQVDGGEFASVVDSLGTAFDTTAYALLCAAIVMFRKMKAERDASLNAGVISTSFRDHLLGQIDGSQSSVSDVALINEAMSVYRRHRELLQRIADAKPER